MSTNSDQEAIVTTVGVPAGVSIAKTEKIISVSGKLGTVTKDFTRLPATLSIEDNNVSIKPYGKRKKDLAIANTAKSIIASMMKGVEKGFEYKLKIVYAHFPITVKVKDNAVFVENFFGERSSRISHIRGNSTKVTVQGDDVIVTGPSLEEVSQTAANIESSTKMKNKDLRVFLDGVYIYSRGE